MDFAALNISSRQDWYQLFNEHEPNFRLIANVTETRLYALVGRISASRSGRLFISPSQARQRLTKLLAAHCYDEADQLFARVWYSFSHRRYARLRLIYVENHRAEVKKQLDKLFAEFAFAKADALAAESQAVLEPEEYAARKLPHVVRYFASCGHNLSEEQARALVLPSRHRLVKARAGSGKTLTITAQADFLIKHGNLSPDQILLLAFNKKAAAEMQQRMQEKFHYPHFRTAMTFHSLAYRLVNPDAAIPSTDEEKNEIVEQVMQLAWTPRLRWLADRFFEATDDPQLEAEASMDAATYLAHRLDVVNHLSIGGVSVKSVGEKWVADLLFSHDLRFDYEKVVRWNGSNYRPDFTINEKNAPYRVLAIIEHWGVHANTPDDAQPLGDGTTAAAYRRQMAEKRKYWQEKGIPLIETSVDDMRAGRAEFEAQLRAKLKEHGIEPTPLDESVLAERVGRRQWNDLTERMARFISRAKNRRKSPAEIKRMWLANRSVGLRTRIFWRLAARVYAEYERFLKANGLMDFQDLLAQAAENIDKAQGQLSFSPKKPTDQAIALSEVRWLLIDEYQDFNPGFDHLIKTLRRHNPHLHLFCVGDDWQAINSFAGSEVAYFKRFVQNLAPESAAETLLPTNYRSLRAIVDAGNALMKGEGEPSVSHHREPGEVYLTEVDKLWLDTLPLPPVKANNPGEGDAEAGKSGFDGGFLGARTLELCTRLMIPALKEGKSVAILNRTNRILGIELADFRQRLISHCGDQWQKSFNARLRVETIHKMKGLQDDLVILTEIVSGRMPLLHQDTRLDAPFYPPDVDPIDEARMSERRLFYVALTRAVETLWILTEQGLHSEFLKDLPVKRVVPSKIPALAPDSISSPVHH